MCLKIVKDDDFKKIIDIKFNSILDGFNKYSFIELSPIRVNNTKVEEDFINTIEEFYQLNEGNLIIDFYKEKLDEDSINYIKNNLDFEDNKYFDNIINSTTNKNIYYKITNKEYIKLLTKLCTRELFFITFYFYKYPITLWGNYNLKFPLFYYEKAILDYYIKIVKKNNLY